jgi:hypothetical protein
MASSAGSGEIAHGVVFELGGLERCPIAGSPQASEWDGVASVGFDAVAGLFRDQRGSDGPTRMPVVAQVSVDPIAPGAGFVDAPQRLGFGLELAHPWIDVGWSGAEGAEGSDLGTVIVSDLGDGDGVLVDLHADEKGVGRGRLCHG